MSTLEKVKQSGLYHRLEEDAELVAALLALRVVAERLAETVARSVPGFTDHSIRHMDALWVVTDKVLTQPELARLTPGEAFLLASGFYLHDIGMAYAATDEGLKRCRLSLPYTSFVASVPESMRTHDVEAQAVALAVRKLHAGAATELATGVIPGTSIYLIEAQTFRDAWGATCGKIAASHHWTLEQVERELGKTGIVPLPGGRTGDLAFVASILRVVDFAHINRERASSIDRAFRQPLGDENRTHWLAQEHVDGPAREGDDLLYRAARPLADVDAWWLYYGMLVGLDEEIRAVRRYLERRSSCTQRFSLQGVRGAASPQEAAVYIAPAGFLPIEINLRTGSIDRLVELLAGESLYGPNPMAAVRELIQNARDAVMLKATMDLTEADRATLGLAIRVSLRRDGENCFLEVTDWGVGMTQKVMTDYLISIASDYWTSQFYTDFPEATERGFHPAGRFGIGFLSVFMLGDEVIVESNRAGGERLEMKLRGVGRRGELRTVGLTSGSGTKVSVRLKNQVASSFSDLPDLVKAYTPMICHPISIEFEGRITTLDPGWLFALQPDDFKAWTFSAIQLLSKSQDERISRSEMSAWRTARLEEAEDVWPNAWPEYSDKSTRLLASFGDESLLCVQGIAIQRIRTPGFVGVIDLERAALDVSRGRVLEADIDDVLKRAKEAMHPQIVEHIDSLASRGLLIDKLEFLDSCVAAYGRGVLRESSVPWVNVLRLPGAIELISSRDLLSRLGRSKSMFVAFNTGPWTAMRKWVSPDQRSPDDELAIVLDGTGRFKPRYAAGEVKTGTLSELWPTCNRTSLFGCLMAFAAEAWQLNADALRAQSGWQHEGSTVWGRLTRP